MNKRLVAVVLSAFSIGIKAQPLGLKQLSDSLLARSYRIEVSRINENIAGTNHHLGNAGALPNLALTGSQGRSINNTRQEFFNGDVREADNAANNSFNMNLRVDWTIFQGFAVKGRMGDLRVQEEMSRWQTVLEMENQLSELASSWYELAAREALRKSYFSAIELSINRLQLAEARQKLGKGGLTETLQARLDLQRDSSLLLQEELRIRQLKYQINSLCFRSPEAELYPDTQLNFSSLPALEELLQLSLQNNRELEMTRLRVEQSQYRLQQAKSGLFPSIGVFGEYNLLQSNNEVGILKSNQSIGPGFGVSLRYNLFQGGAVNREITNARRVTEQSILLRKEQERLLRLSVQLAYENALTQRRLYDFEESTLQTLQENLDITLKQLELGVITDIQFREIQQQYLEGQARKINAAYQVVLADVELARLRNDLLALVMR